MVNPGRSSRIRRQPARISRTSMLGDDKKWFDVSPDISLSTIAPLPPPLLLLLWKILGAMSIGIDGGFVVESRRVVGGKRTSFCGANLTGKWRLPGGIWAVDDDDAIVELDDVRPDSGTTDAVPVYMVADAAFGDIGKSSADINVSSSCTIDSSLTPLICGSIGLIALVFDRTGFARLKSFFDAKLTIASFPGQSVSSSSPSRSLSLVSAASLSLLLNELELRKSFRLPQSIPLGSSNCNCIFIWRRLLCFCLWCECEWWRREPSLLLTEHSFGGIAPFTMSILLDCAGTVDAPKVDSKLPDLVANFNWLRPPLPPPIASDVPAFNCDVVSSVAVAVVDAKALHLYTSSACKLKTREGIRILDVSVALLRSDKHVESNGKPTIGRFVSADVRPPPLLDESWEIFSIFEMIVLFSGKMRSHCFE